MTITAYLIIGLVAWGFTIVNYTVKDGWESVKASHNPGWIWLTDMCITALVWPLIALAFVIHMISIMVPKEREL